MNIYNVNYRHYIRNLIPNFLRLDNLVKFIYCIIKPLQTLNDTFYGSSVYDYNTYLYWNYYLKFNSQTIYLEKYLNDKYDPVNVGIYIENSTSYYTYLYNVAELKETYFYNLWQVGDTYAEDERVSYNNRVWKSLQNGNIGNIPQAGAYWELVGPNSFLFQVGESSSQYDFIVYVPASVTYNSAEMISSINQYKIAGKNYTILTY